MLLIGVIILVISTVVVAAVLYRVMGQKEAESTRSQTALVAHGEMAIRIIRRIGNRRMA